MKTKENNGQIIYSLKTSLLRNSTLLNEGSRTLQYNYVQYNLRFKMFSLNLFVLVHLFEGEGFKFLNIFTMTNLHVNSSIVCTSNLNVQKVLNVICFNYYVLIMD